MEVDFDPLKEDGRTDINDTVEDEYDSLIKHDDESTESWRSRIKNKFGPGYRYAERRIAELFKTKNPGSREPEYMELTNMGHLTSETPIEAAKERLLELYPNFDFDYVKLSTKGEVVYIQAENAGKGASKWTKPQPLFTQEDEISAHVERLKGFQMASKSLMERLGQLNDRVELEQNVEELKKELQDREKEYMEQNRLLLDSHGREKADLRQRVQNLLSEKERAQKAFDLANQELREKKSYYEAAIDGAIHEREELLKEINAKEEKLQQTQQAIEDLEEHAQRQQEIINDNTRSEEEIEAARAELETIQERIDNLREQEETLERELGLTTREKIKRLFKKYGFTVASVLTAVGIVVGVIVSQLKSGLTGVAKGVGNGLKTLGKKLGEILPGMVGAIASFIFRTAGEVVGFLAKNAWLLIVAVVVYFIEKLRFPRGKKIKK